GSKCGKANQTSDGGIQDAGQTMGNAAGAFKPILSGRGRLGQAPEGKGEVGSVTRFVKHFRQTGLLKRRPAFMLDVMKTLTTREFFHSPGLLKSLRPGQSLTVTDKGAPAFTITKAGERRTKTAEELRREAREI